MGLSEGNKLHAVFWDGRKRLWYTTKIIDAEWIPPKPMSEMLIRPELTPSVLSTPLDTSVATPTSWLVDQQLHEAPSKFKLTPGQLLIVSVIPAVLLIAFVAVSTLYKRIK
jgi:hypothetical protein